MPENRDPLQRVTGLVVGSDPEKKITSKGDYLVKFRISQSRTYDKGDSQFYDIAVWNEQLQPVVLENVSRGDQIIAEGYIKDTNPDFAPNMNAVRIGLVNWLRKETLEKVESF